MSDLTVTDGADKLFCVLVIMQYVWASTGHVDLLFDSTPQYLLQNAICLFLNRKAATIKENVSDVGDLVFNRTVSK